MSAPARLARGYAQKASARVDTSLPSLDNGRTAGGRRSPPAVAAASRVPSPDVDPSLPFRVRRASCCTALARFSRLPFSLVVAATAMPTQTTILSQAVWPSGETQCATLRVHCTWSDPASIGSLLQPSRGETRRGARVSPTLEAAGVGAQTRRRAGWVLSRPALCPAAPCVCVCVPDWKRKKKKKTSHTCTRRAATVCTHGTATPRRRAERRKKEQRGRARTQISPQHEGRESECECIAVKPVVSLPLDWDWTSCRLRHASAHARVEACTCCRTSEPVEASRTEPSRAPFLFPFLFLFFS